MSLLLTPALLSTAERVGEQKPTRCLLLLLLPSHNPLSPILTPRLAGLPVSFGKGSEAAPLFPLSPPNSQLQQERSVKPEIILFWNQKEEELLSFCHFFGFLLMNHFLISFFFLWCTKLISKDDFSFILIVFPPSLSLQGAVQVLQF